MKRRTAGNTLASTLVVIAIICILAAVYYLPRGGESARKDGKGVTTVGATLMAAKDEKCRSAMSQIKQLIYVQNETGGDDADKPKTIDEIRGLPESMKRCPIGNEPYVFDPVTQTAHCVHPGHEKY